jgi:hypothetical protein
LCWRTPLPRARITALAFALAALPATPGWHWLAALPATPGWHWLAAPAKAQNAPLYEPRLTDPRNPQRFDPLGGERFGRPPDPVARSQPATLPPPAAGATGFDSTGAIRKQKARKRKPGEPYPLPPPPKPAVAVPGGPPQKSSAPQIAARAPYAEAYRPAGALPRPPRPFKPFVEPFDPIGLRLGSFLLKPSIELTRGYDSNPSRIPNGTSSPYFVVAPELQVQSQWLRHELKASLRGSYTRYDDLSSSDRPFLDSKVNGRIDVTRDSRFDLEGRFLIGTDYPGSPNLTADIAKLPVYTTLGGSLGYAQRFNRLELSLKGNFDRTEYRDSELTDGTTFSNRDRNYNQQGGQVRASYELLPGVRPFVEYGADWRLHDLDVDRNGERRNSRGTTPKLGTSFEITRILMGEFSIGYLTRRYDDPGLAELSGVVADASLTWYASGLTTLKLLANSRAEESILAGVSGALRRDIGLQVDHAFRRWLIGTLQIGYGDDDYVGLDRTDKRASIGAALTYKLNRNFWLKGEARHDRLRSNVADADYDANIFTLGVKLQQ